MYTNAPQRFVRARIDRDAASARFTAADRRLLARFTRLFRSSAARKLERIWLPCYLAEFELSSSKGPGAVTTLIDAWSGAFSIAENDWDANTDAPGEETFTPRLTPQEAIELAQKQLLHAVMLQRAHGGMRPVVEGVIRAELLYRPYWVLYYERWRSRLDIRILDAVTGQIAGARTKDGVLRAFRETDCRKHPLTRPSD